MRQQQQQNYAALCQLHSALVSELAEVAHLPFPCKTELELRVGILQYSPVSSNGKFCAGVTETAFNAVVALFECHEYRSEEVCDYIYHTVDRKSKVRLSYDVSGNLLSCICKSWIKDVKLEQCFGKYDARVNICREIAASPEIDINSQRPAFIRRKQRISVPLCEGRWVLDLTRAFSAPRTVTYEIELEACDAAVFVNNSTLLEADLQYCFHLLQPALTKTNIQASVNHLTAQIQQPPVSSISSLANKINAVYNSICTPHELSY